MRDHDRPWYESFYGQTYRDLYDVHFSAEQSEQEARFAASALKLQPGDRVLDLCCGRGRHAVPLARLGLNVTGLDQSAEYLSLARTAAREAGVNIELLQADMRDIPASKPFDAVVNLFSSFGYLASDAEDARVLRAAHAALKPNGGLLLDLLNREWVLLNQTPDDQHTGPKGIVYLEHRDFDLRSGRNHVTFTAQAPDGTRHELPGHHIRLYTLTELIAMLDAAGFDFETAYGGFDGAPYAMHTRRMIVLARSRG
jgi:SAM-dependent methyltransferase